MTQVSQLYTVGLFMGVATVVALWIQAFRLHVGVGSLYVTGLLAILVGVSGFVLGDLWGET